jgi:diguanylate cyclase (GGDEF)-like protein/PAS domain S-box-containing protein
MMSLTTRATPERLYRLLADNATDVISLLDAEGRHLYVSPSVTALTGYDPDELVGADGWSFMHPDDLADLQSGLQTAAAEGRVVTLEYRIRHADGHYVWVETKARTVGEEIQCSTRDISARREASAELARRLAQQSAVARLGRMVMERAEVAVVRHEAARAVAETRHAEPDSDFLQAVAHILASATERDRYEEQMRHDGLHDALTGLPNRTLLLDRLRQASARARRDGSRVAVIFLDLDNLKVLNDSLGHQAGDQLLRAIGPRLRRELRGTDTVARFGGDEFAVVCSDVTDEHHGAAIAERLVRAFEAPFVVDGEERFGSASVGVVITDPQAPREPEELLSDADAAMYRAKERGRGRIELFDEGMRSRLVTRLAEERRLRVAVAHEELDLHYQPVVALPGLEVVGVEGLVRWRHPERGVVAPAEFIPLAEESGLITDLGHWVLEEGCRQAGGWVRELGPDRQLEVALNLSTRQLSEQGLAKRVEALLDRHGLTPGGVALCLEITESFLLEDPVATGTVLDELRGLGVRLAIDDFGTGYSSLSYLRRFPLDALKIDRAFVSGLGLDSDSRAIASAIVEMAHALGLQVVAEGVEEEVQVEVLVEMGCDRAQGFLFSRPVPAPELWDVLCPEDGPTSTPGSRTPMGRR